jgi:hypothetical protein
VTLANIARVCRANGITSYDDGTLKLTFGPRLPAQPDKSGAAVTSDRDPAAAPAKAKRPNLVDLMLSDEEA